MRAVERTDSARDIARAATATGLGGGDGDETVVAHAPLPRSGVGNGDLNTSK